MNEKTPVQAKLSDFHPETAQRIYNDLCIELVETRKQLSSANDVIEAVWKWSLKTVPLTEAIQVFDRDVLPLIEKSRQPK